MAADLEITESLSSESLSSDYYEEYLGPAIRADFSDVSLVNSRINGNTLSSVSASSRPHVLVGLDASLRLESTTVEGGSPQDIVFTGDGHVYADVSRVYVGVDLTMNRSLPLAQAPQGLFLTADDPRVLQIKQVPLPRLLSFSCFDCHAEGAVQGSGTVKCIGHDHEVLLARTMLLDSDAMCGSSRSWYKCCVRLVACPACQLAAHAEARLRWDRINRANSGNLCGELQPAHAESCCG
jgi:hypothetical protein